MSKRACGAAAGGLHEGRGCGRHGDGVEQAKAKPTMLGWFVGQVMKSSGGKANPGAVNDLLKAKLGIE